MKIKICGITDLDNLQAIVGLNPDYLGFIFYNKSSRLVNNPFALLRDRSAFIKYTAVVVNEEYESLIELIEDYKFDAIQLHGNESVAYCKELNAYRKNKALSFEIIKVFGIDEDFDFKVLDPYKSYCNYFLFDTKSKEHGGTGRTFNWEILKKYDQSVPFFISGGIGLEQLDEIKTLKATGMNIYAVDMNSRLETAPGIKNIDKVKEAITILKGKI